MRLEDVGPAEIEAARERIAGTALRTPLVPLDADPAETGGLEVHLKLENLQPIGSFKLRGAANALALCDPAELALGVTTASAGNMAQGVAFVARRLGIPCRVVVPDHAPRAKLEAIERLGATWSAVPWDDWWRILVTHDVPGLEGAFVHPVCDARVVAGNGTIGLELLEDLPELDAVLVPFGGGGLSSGIAAAVRERGVRVLGCEVETAAPLSAALAAGRPVPVEHRASFVDGIGAGTVLEEMWPLVSELLDGALVSSLAEVEGALARLVRRQHVVAEGAGAAPVAAALARRHGLEPGARVVCVVSGGNLDPGHLIRILGRSLGPVPGTDPVGIGAGNPAPEH